MDDEIDEQMLLRRALAGGTEVTSDQLKRWRRAGLVPRPRQEHRRGRRGSWSRYPAETAGQLISVARLHATTHRLADLVVSAWWEGLWADPGALRRALTARLERMSAQARAVSDQHADAFDAADEIVRSASKHELSPLLALMCKRLPGGRGDLREVLWLFAALGLGAEYDWIPDEASVQDSAPTIEELLTRAAGIDRAQHDRVAGKEPWLSDDVRVRDIVTSLCEAGAFELDDFSRPVREASDAPLDQARDDARLFCEGLATIGRGMQSVFGDDHAGMASLAALTIDDPVDLAGTIRTMLILRHVAGNAAFERIRQTVDENYVRFIAIQQLHEALPQHAHLLRVDLPQRLAKLPDPDAQQVRADVERYLADHPETTRALGLGDAKDAVREAPGARTAPRPWAAAQP